MVGDGVVRLEEGFKNSRLVGSRNPAKTFALAKTPSGYNTPIRNPVRDEHR